MAESTLYIPDNATRPRIITDKHPNAIGSYGPRAVEWGFSQPMHMGRVVSPRWWQQLALNRALEYDELGNLCWRTVIVSAPRQVGKSVLERVICAWRLHSSEYFENQTQDILHVAHKISAALEVWRPAARWARGAYGRDSVRYGQGREQIELPNGSRWLIQASNESAGVAFSLTMVLVDEAWRVARSVVDANLRPTMAEASNPQLWLVSTAGTSSSDLMAGYRAAAMSGESPNTAIIEWSAPPDPDLDISDPEVWRNCSPHWDERRRDRMAEAFADSTEWAFRQQWLNQWVPQASNPFIGAEIWHRARADAPLPDGPVAFGVDVASDRSHATIAACAGDTVELVEHREGVTWLTRRLIELVERWHPLGVAIDGLGPAATVADSLSIVAAEAGLTSLNGREMAICAGQFFDRLQTGTLRFVPHPELTAAVAGARKRNHGQAWIFARETPDASGVPLIAATLAVWAFEHGTNGEVSAIW
jgi:hypothetical protein